MEKIVQKFEAKKLYATAYVCALIGGVQDKMEGLYAHVKKKFDTIQPVEALDSIHSQ